MNHFVNGFQEKGQKENPKDGLTVMHLMEREDTNPVEDKKEKKDQNTQHADQHLLNVKQKEKVRPGVKQNNMKLLQLLREAKESFEEFATKRLAGAEKIADTTQEAGGLSLLTYKHYKVKLPYYKKAVAGKLDKEAAKKEFEETYKKISLDMTQNEFQIEMGRLEVLGELLIREE